MLRRQRMDSFIFDWAQALESVFQVCALQDLQQQLSAKMLQDFLLLTGTQACRH